MRFTLDTLMEATEVHPVIPAIKNEEWLNECGTAECGVAYVLYGDICNIAENIRKVKDSGKHAIVHLDLIDGLSTKEISVDFLKKYTDVDGIISMKPAIIRRAKELGFFTIQRFYMMDALNYANIQKYMKQCDPDVFEFMPACLPKPIHYLFEDLKKPMILSGLILDKQDVIASLQAGAIAVSTTNRDLWTC